MKIQYCMNCFTPLGDNEECPNCRFNLKYYHSDPQYLPPETILHGRYLVGKVLGEGGFGITYLGFDLTLERKVAIKEYFPSGNVWRDASNGLTVNPSQTRNLVDTFTSGKEKCMKEAQAIAKLDDIDSVVRVLEYFSENNTAYVIMEYISGVTLKDYAQGLPARMSFEDVMTLMMPVMQALSTVHKRGFIHRDISPDNIMITPDGKAKLLDFGAVKNLSGGNSFTENPTIKRGFSALEQYSSEGMLGAWTDVYAICATIFYLLTGRTVAEPMERLGPGGDHVAEQLKGALPDEAYLALLQGLAIQPRDRLQTMDELISRLSGSLPKQKDPAQDSFFRRNLKWLIPAAAAIVIAAAVLIVFAIPKNNSAESVDKQKYTYGKNLANMMSDGMTVNAGQFNYITEYYDAEHGHIYSIDNSSKITEVTDLGFGMNYLGNTLYYINGDGRSICSATLSGDDDEENAYKIETVYSGSAIGQLLAVGIDSKEYLYFNELVGEQVYIQRFDLETKEKTTVSSGYSSIMFSSYDGKIYYLTDKYDLWTVGMDGKNETCIVKDDKTQILAFCFVDDKLYLQTDKSIAAADVNGHIESIVSGVSPIFQLTDRCISPLIGNDGKLFYIDKESRHLFRYDISEKKAMEIVPETCYNYEITPDALIYTTMDTDVPAVNVLTFAEDGEPQTLPLCMWAAYEAEEYHYGISEYGNAANESFTAVNDNELYYISGGSLCLAKLGTGESTVKNSRSTSKGSRFGCINISDNNKLYVVGYGSNVSSILTLDGTNIYTGNDIHSLQYYKRDSFEKLLFTDRDENGDYYAYSVNIDGTAKTRISHVPCAWDTLDIYEDYLIYTDVSHKHLYAAYITGKKLAKSYEIYTVTDEDLSINQASFQGKNTIRLSLNGKTASSRFVALSISGEVQSDDEAEIGRFVYCGNKLYAIDPKSKFLYCYSSPDTDLTERTLISNYTIDAVNKIPYNDKTVVALRSSATGMSYVISPEDSKPYNMSTYDLNKCFE